MLFEDFVANFTDISVCHQINTSWFSLQTSYTESVFTGAWISESSLKAAKGRQGAARRAGGCANYKETFLENPQYRFDVLDTMTSPMFVSLMQKDIRERRRQGAAYLTIGIHVMKVYTEKFYHFYAVMLLTIDYGSFVVGRK